MPHFAADPFHRSPPRRATLCAVAALAAAFAPSLALAAVEWHADLETAHAASRISRRPVLAVFVAGWGEAAHAVETTCLGSAEAEAVLAACFEPVRLDIDEHQGLARAVGVTHVPTACVLAADDTALATFEMAGTPAAFVTAAILAAQRAATHEHDSVAVRGGTPTAAAPPGAAPEPTAATAAAAAFSSGDDAGSGPQRSARGSMARVAAKVRDLSAFATGQPRPATPETPVVIASSSRSAPQPQSNYPALSWPAEQPAAPPTAPAPAPAPTIEPSATTATPTTASPWLDSAAPAAPSAQAAATPESPAQLPATAQPQSAPEPKQSGLVAALQKPFSLFAKPATDMPTMPPAWPRNPLAAATPAAPPTAAEPAAPAEPAAVAPDVHGSMPLGLEGYCPVTLVDRGAWTEGRAQWGARHRGRTYLFAGPEEQRTFLADPDRYAPALSGDDPVLALDRQASTPGQRRYGVTYQSRIYLFATPETRTAFTADPSRYTTRVTVAERTPSAAGGTRTY